MATTMRIDIRTLIAAVGFLCGSCQSAFAETHHTFWEIKGKHNTVYLLGSVHLLQGKNSTLPPEILRVYKDSKMVTMELDPAVMSSGGLQESALKLEMLPEGQTLSEVLGPKLYPQFQSYANTLGFDTDFMSHDQPWFAALTLQRFAMARSGFNAESGVEMQLIQLAKPDSKTIIGLESLEEQLELFAHMSMEEQRQYLRATIRESGVEATELTTIVAAWQQGDTVTLEKTLRKGFAESPAFYKRLVTERNRKWLPRFIELLNRDEDCFIVVGALHLIGHGGMLELLRQHGFRAVQQ